MVVHLFLNNNKALDFLPINSIKNGGITSALSKNINPQELLDGIHTGKYPVISRGARGDVVVDFGKPIGIDNASGAITNFGTIHSGKNGAHIVPANPKLIKKVK